MLFKQILPKNILHLKNVPSASINSLCFKLNGRNYIQKATILINKGGICIPNSTTGDLTVNDVDLFQRSNVTA